MNEHGYCPHCKMDLDGDLIYEYFLSEYNGDEGKAIRTADMYGATKTKGRWGKRIAIYSMKEDRTVSWQCPECDHVWSR